MDFPSGTIPITTIREDEQIYEDNYCHDKPYFEMKKNIGRIFFEKNTSLTDWAVTFFMRWRLSIKNSQKVTAQSGKLEFFSKLGQYGEFQGSSHRPTCDRKAEQLWDGLELYEKVGEFFAKNWAGKNLCVKIEIVGKDEVNKELFM